MKTYLKKVLKILSLIKLSDIFDALNQNSSGNEKRILIFDEFQNIAKVSEEFADYLFTHLQTSRKNVLIILCSSQVEWIENSMIRRFGLPVCCAAFLCSSPAIYSSWHL